MRIVNPPRRNMWRLLALLAAVALGAGFAVGSGESRSTAKQDEIVSLALAGRVHLLLALPEGYETGSARYPVVYFLHGLPAGPAAYLGNRWIGNVLAKVGPAILVEPQGARSRDTDPEYLDHGPGRNWATFISRELPAYVDEHFRTIRSRRGRALVGISAGGYGAAMLGLNDLDHFSVIESWSGYFHPTDPTGTRPVPGGAGSNVHALISMLRRDERGRPTFLAFYVGGDDARFRAENERFATELADAHIPHVFAIYEGAHSSSLWQRHATDWLALALRHLASPTAR